MKKLHLPSCFVTRNSLILQLVITLFLISPLRGEEIVVHLPVDNDKTSSVYLAKLRPCESALHQTIQETLVYDLNHNGRTNLLPINETLQYQAHLEDPDEAFKVKKWKEANVRYVVVPKIVKGELQIKVFDVNTSTLKTLNSYTLTGDLTQDIRGIHKLSDVVHEIMYGNSGISSKRILYSYQPKVDPEGQIWHAEIWEMDYDGRNARQVTEENHYTISPSVFPLPSSDSNNYHFMYVTYKQGQPRIYFASRKTPKGRPLVPLRGNQLLPSFARKGDKIAFISDVGGKADLFVQSFSIERGVLGKPMQVYSFPGAVQASPSFSSDGSKLAFVCDKSGTPRVYMIDIAEISKTRKIPEAVLISKKNRDNTAPSWSADGKKIAYSAKINGVRQIWIYDVETKEEWQLTVGLGDKENPTWAPDSFHLAYNTTSPTFDIFVLNINQREPIKLTEGPGKKHYPTFEQ